MSSHHGGPRFTLEERHCGIAAARLIERGTRTSDDDDAALLDYLRAARDCRVRVAYTAPPPGHLGRLHAHVPGGLKCCYMRGIKRLVRGALARNLYFDVDMANAQPSLLLQELRIHVPPTVPLDSRTRPPRP